MCGAWAGPPKLIRKKWWRGPRNVGHNIGLDSVIEGQGQGSHTGKSADMGKWKVPSLRNLAFSAPYMHDGRFATLEQVIDFYQSGDPYSATLDPLIRNAENAYSKFMGRKAMGLSDAQKRELLAFLSTLNDFTYSGEALFAPRDSALSGGIPCKGSPWIA